MQTERDLWTHGMPSQNPFGEWQRSTIWICQKRLPIADLNNCHKLTQTAWWCSTCLKARSPLLGCSIMLSDVLPCCFVTWLGSVTRLCSATLLCTAATRHSAWMYCSTLRCFAALSDVLLRWCWFSSSTELYCSAMLRSDPLCCTHRLRSLMHSIAHIRFSKTSACEQTSATITVRTIETTTTKTMTETSKTETTNIETTTPATTKTRLETTTENRTATAIKTMIETTTEPATQTTKTVMTATVSETTIATRTDTTTQKIVQQRLKEITHTSTEEASTAPTTKNNDWENNNEQIDWQINWTTNYGNDSGNNWNNDLVHMSQTKFTMIVGATGTVSWTDKWIETVDAKYPKQKCELTPFWHMHAWTQEWMGCSVLLLSQPTERCWPTRHTARFWNSCDQPITDVSLCHWAWNSDRMLWTRNKYKNGACMMLAHVRHCRACYPTCGTAPNHWVEYNIVDGKTTVSHWWRFRKNKVQDRIRCWCRGFPRAHSLMFKW